MFMTLGYGPWPRVARKNGLIKVVFLLNESVDPQGLPNTVTVNGIGHIPIGTMMMDILKYWKMINVTENLFGTFSISNLYIAVGSGWQRT